MSDKQYKTFPKYVKKMIQDSFYVKVWVNLGIKKMTVSITKKEAMRIVDRHLPEQMIPVSYDKDKKVVTIGTY